MPERCALEAHDLVGRPPADHVAYQGVRMAEQSTLRQYAVQCMERAEQVKDAAAKIAWVEMAANWLRIAGAKSRATNLGAVQQQQQIQAEQKPKSEV